MKEPDILEDYYELAVGSTSSFHLSNYIPKIIFWPLQYLDYKLKLYFTIYNTEEHGFERGIPIRLTAQIYKNVKNIQTRFRINFG